MFHPILFHIKPQRPENISERHSADQAEYVPRQTIDPKSPQIFPSQNQYKIPRKTHGPRKFPITIIPKTPRLLSETRPPGTIQDSIGKSRFAGNPAGIAVSRARASTGGEVCSLQRTSQTPPSSQVKAGAFGLAAAGSVAVIVRFAGCEVISRAIGIS